MISFDEAFEIVMQSARLLDTKRVGIFDNAALNRVLREDIVSDIDIPPFNKSAMDGFACRRADLGNELNVVETIAAGTLPTKTIRPNQCAKIMTGAVVPTGADCVIMKEFTESLGENTIRFTGGNTEDNICYRGEDLRAGDLALRAGQLIKAQHIAVLASAGCVEPLVSVRPKVGVIATGSELVDPQTKPAPGQIRSSNTFQLAAQAAEAGAIVKDYGIAADTREAIGNAVDRAIADNDVVILSGGVSAGDYDLVAETLKENGVRLLFEKVAINPGRPMVFGVSDRAACFGLPGNPVSSFVMFELLVRPFLFKMAGHDFRPVVSYRQLAEPLAGRRADRDSWRPVAFADNGSVMPVSYHGSAHIDALCRADGLVCVPAGTAELPKGATVAVRLI